MLLMNLTNCKTTLSKRGATTMTGTLRKFRRLAGVAILAGTFAGTAQAQTNDGELEEVVVKGIRTSIQDALEIKRGASGFVDAISAQDIGKLPDQNVAEALQRVPGVAIQRDSGEGNFVSIRGLGPEFVRATYNGRTITSGEEGREFNFDILPAESISVLQVIKSPTASLEEGGVGGTVDVQTAKPLDLGRQAAFSVRGLYSDNSEETDPRLSGLYSWANDDNTFGALIGVAFSEQSIQNEEATTFGWRPTGRTSSYDTDGDGVGDLTADPFWLFSSNGNVNLEDRERTTVNAALQWRPDDSLEVNVDALYTQYDISWDFFQTLSLIEPLRVPLNADGSITVSNFRIEDNTVVSATHSGFTATSVHDLRNLDRTTSIIGLNIAKTAGDWTFTGDAYYTSADTEDGTTGSVLQTTDNSDPANPVVSDFTGTYTLNGSGAPVVSLQVPGGDFLDPSLWSTRNQQAGLFEREDEELGFRLDVKRDIGGGVLSSINAGIGFRDRTKGVEAFASNPSLGRVPVTSNEVITLPVSLNNGDPFEMGNRLFANTLAARQLSFNTNGTPASDLVLSPNPLEGFEVEEEVLSAYVQFDFDGDVGNVPFTGNFGVRLVRTNQTSSGTSATNLVLRIVNGLGQIDSETGPVSFENSYTNLLPSLNMAFEVSEDLFLRFAFSETVTRPTLVDISPRLDINATQQSAVAGNPLLDPFESQSFDVGLEWYFGDASALYGALFHKNIDNLVVQTTLVENIAGVDFVNGVTRPRNQDTADVNGIELGYSQSFESGFGVNANITFTESTAEFDPAITTDVFTLEGLSKINYNLVGYYESGPFAARLAYNFRDKFVRQSVGTFGNAIFVDDFDQLDASVSYDITDSLTVFVEGVNLTDTELTEFRDIPLREGGQEVTGARYSFGVRGTF